MGRGSRIEFPGAIYHVINRGNNKNDIFLDDKDCNVFLKKLREIQEEKPFHLYSYCIMPNHFHLLIESIDDPLSKIMQMISSAYALYFNSRYKRVGHLFQSRYKATICEKERHLLTLVRYIHLNPIRAKLVSDINDYKWSSHQYYIGQAKNKNLSIERLFKYMGGSISNGYNAYKNILNEKLEIKIKSNIFGTEDFIKKIKNESIGVDKVNASKIKNKTLPKILDEISKEFKVSKNAVLSYNRFKDSDHARKMFCYKSAKEYGYKLKEISCFIGRDVTVIDRAIRSIKKNIKKNDSANKF